MASVPIFLSRKPKEPEFSCWTHSSTANPRAQSAKSSEKPSSVRWAPLSRVWGCLTLRGHLHSLHLSLGAGNGILWLQTRVFASCPFVGFSPLNFLFRCTDWHVLIDSLNGFWFKLPVQNIFSFTPTYSLCPAWISRLSMSVFGSRNTT